MRHIKGFDGWHCPKTFKGQRLTKLSNDEGMQKNVKVAESEWKMYKALFVAFQGSTQKNAALLDHKLASIWHCLK